MIDSITRLFQKNDPTNDATTAQPGAPSATEQVHLEQAANMAREFAANPSPAVAARIAESDLPIELRCQALAVVKDAALLRHIALNDKIARARLAASQQLTAVDDLEALRRDSTDKAVQRHVRDALKLLREQERSAAETRARINHLLQAIAQHARRGFEPLYDAKLDSLETGWRDIATQTTATEQEQFAELAGLARDTVQRHAAEIQARTETISAKQELIAACHELDVVVKRLAHEDLTHSLPAVTALRSTQQTRWEEAAILVKNGEGIDAPLTQRYRAAAAMLDAWLASAAELSRVGLDASALLTALAENDTPDTDTLDHWQENLDALRERIDWPQGLAQPSLLADLAQAGKKLQALYRAQQADVRAQLLHLRKRRHALKRMIDEGQLRAAVRTHHWLLKRLGELPAKDADVERSALAPLEEALKQLHDWYEFASVPKKIELCERIETLSPHTSHIAERAEQVRLLRQQWNALCAADPDADPELRARFDRAATMAFAPCAAWYAEQHRLQDENLGKRHALCVALADEISVFDATSTHTLAEWKALEQRERDIRTEWKKYEPVRWPAARESQEKFTKLIAGLRAKLDAERTANANRKRALIERANALATEEPVESALRDAKKLQSDWKEIGYTDPREDHALWKRFRTAADAVFARRDAARDAERLALRAAAAAAAARRAAEETKQQQRAQAIITARQADIDTAHAVADAESQWLAGATGNDAPVDTTSLQASLNALPEKSALATALRLRVVRMNAGTRPTDAELAANATKLAQLTLNLEILLNAPSPPAFAEARMAAKINRLNAALRGGKNNVDDQRSLEDAWLATGPTSGEARAPLLTRLRAALNVSPSASAE